jgi:RecA-family ATPase
MGEDTDLIEVFKETDSFSKPKLKSKINDYNFSSALELYNQKVEAIPKLLDPFFQKVGLASLVGTSDSGKSTFLRQLSLSIALNLENFLGFPLYCTTNKVIYVSTEDDPSAVSFSIRKQVDFFLEENKDIDVGLLNNLEYVFETENLLKKLSFRLKVEPVDLIIIDAFTDVFSKELNANTQVRQFLNDYDKLAKKHNCLILFLHHIGKNTLRATPNKDSIIGSQAFEAKMRVVVELRPNQHKPNLKDLWVLKSNFLDSNHKTKSYVLEVNDDMVFSSTGDRSGKSQNSKSNNPLIKEKAVELRGNGLTVREIEEALKNTEFETSKSSIGEMIKGIPKPIKKT